MKTDLQTRFAGGVPVTNVPFVTIDGGQAHD
jgi:hypothetical protein